MGRWVALALILGIGLVLSQQPTHAAFVTATILQNEPLPDGRFKLTVRFTGNAGEPPIVREVYLDGGSTGIWLRQWAIDQAAALNSVRTLGRGAALQVGQTVDLTAITSPAPTAKQTWFADLSRLRALQVAIAAGAAPATADDVLQASVLSRFSSIPITDADF